MSEEAPPLIAKQIEDDLASGVPERVASALATLQEATYRGDQVRLAMPEPDCLEAFGDQVPPDVLKAFLYVLEYYTAFEPEPGARRWHAMLEAAIKFGHGVFVRTVAMGVIVDRFPDDAARDCLTHLERIGLDTPKEIEAAHLFVDYLLDAPETRATAVSFLRAWSWGGHYPEVVQALRPRLTDEERAELDEIE